MKLWQEKVGLWRGQRDTRALTGLLVTVAELENCQSGPTY
jgi:hypothetical protein